MEVTFLGNTNYVALNTLFITRVRTMTKHRKLIYAVASCFIILIFISCGFTYKEKYKRSFTSADKNQKIIYLTFDDGPSILTNRILDILKVNNVHATFFVIGNQIKGYEETLKRTYSEGHAIGLHTYTHKFKNIYSSQSVFIKEMYDSRDEINKVIGVSPNIIRFPGGSRNRLNEEALKLLHSCNFKIYDWNMVISDGANHRTSADRLFKEATMGKAKPDVIILLMHCDYMHKNTCIALPGIINYYKNSNYDFRVITEDTPEIYFPIKK
jgi:peptidoglycan/xylan/chitin deacetylase (PgdA/CDA1 family)